MQNKNFMSTKMVVISLMAILILQLGMMIYFGNQKSGYHIDEIATYGLSNFPNGFVTRMDGILEKWIDGQFFYNVLSVEGDERFNYEMTYHNQEGDVHPPLYYFVIHTVASIFKGTFSKWIGILPNMVFCMLTTVVLYMISGKITDNIPLSLIVTMTWGLSIGAMTSAMFIRMYAMLTLFCGLLVLVHLHAVDEVIKTKKLGNKTLFFLLICTVLGILTQYYFLIFCFFLCGCFFFYLLINKKWKTLWKYTLIEFGAIGISYCIFPEMYKHIFSGYRGKEAFSNFSQSMQDIENLKKIFSIFNRQLFNGWGKFLFFSLIAIILFLLITRVFFKIIIEQKEEKIFVIIRLQDKKQFSIEISKENILLTVLVTVSLGYTLIVVKIAPYQTDRYYMCIYPILVLVTIDIIYKILSHFSQSELKLFSIIGICFISITLLSYKSQMVGYVNRSYVQRTEALEKYYGLPAIMLNGYGYDAAPDAWLYECGNYSAVYRCAKKQLDGIANAAESYDLSNGFVIVAYGYSETEDELFQKLDEYVDIGSHELITKIGCPVYFCTLEGT